MQEIKRKWLTGITLAILAAFTYFYFHSPAKHSKNQKSRAVTCSGHKPIKFLAVSNTTVLRQIRKENNNSTDLRLFKICTLYFKPEIKISEKYSIEVLNFLNRKVLLLLFPFHCHW